MARTLSIAEAEQASLSDVLLLRGPWTTVVVWTASATQDPARPADRVAVAARRCRRRSIAIYLSTSLARSLLGGGRGLPCKADCKPHVLFVVMHSALLDKLMMA